MKKNILALLIFTAVFTISACKKTSDPAPANQTVTTKPVASSTFTKNGLTVTFTNTSTSAPTSYSWNFGDGSAVSTEINPVHTYATAGTYTIVLTVTNAGGSSTQSQTITVAELQPAIASSTYTKKGLIVTFTNTSSNSPTSYSWNFGDGTVASTDVNPVHTYSAAGTYTVTLTATNSDGSNTQTQSITVTQLNARILAVSLRPSSFYTVTTDKDGTDPDFYFTVSGSIVYTSDVAYNIPLSSLPYTWTLSTPFEIPASKFSKGLFIHMLEYDDANNSDNLVSEGYDLSKYPTYPSKIRLNNTAQCTELTVEWYE